MKEFTRWRAQHFHQVNDFSWRPKTAATEERIRAELAQHAVAIRLEQAAADIPEPLYAVQPFEWDAAHRDRILTFNRDGQVQFPDGKLRVAHNAASHLAVLRQLSSGVLYEGDSAGAGHILSTRRMEALDSVIDQVQGPVLVAIYFRAEVQALLQRYGSRARAFVGDTPPSQRSELIDSWNSDRIPILLAAPSAMGHGINLQHGSARTIVWHSLSFDWAQHAQFNARLVRSGQRKTISIVSLQADVGIDRAVLAALNKKEDAERAVLAEFDINRRFSLKEPQHGAVA
jgi:hypothetical protein